MTDSQKFNTENSEPYCFQSITKCGLIKDAKDEEARKENSQILIRQKGKLFYVCFSFLVTNKATPTAAATTLEMTKVDLRPLPSPHFPSAPAPAPLLSASFQHKPITYACQ